MRFGTIKELGTFFVGDDGTSYVVRSGSDLVFYDGNNPSGATLSDLLAGGGGGGAAYTAPFVDGDLVGGVLTVTHALNEQYVVVAVYDDTDSQVMPDSVVVTSTTTVDVNLGSFGSLTGTWHVVVLAKGSGGGGGGGGDSYFSSTTPGSIYTSGSAAFVGAGDEWGVVDSPADKGTDVAFYVSGSGGTKDGATPGVALFGGDVVISGTLHGGSPLKIGSNMTLGSSVVTTKGFRVASPGSISDGVIVLDSAYGDLSSTFFTPGNSLYVYDSGLEVWQKLVYAGSTWDGTNTIISLREGNFNVISGPAYVVGGDGYDLLTGYHPSADEVIDAGVGGKFAAGYSAAMNNGAYAQGDNAFALGAGSHAEGMGTIAIGESSHAEGTFTLARGLNSHAEGYQTLAYGDMSRATGNQTVANPPYRSISGAVTGVIQLSGLQGDITGSYGAGDNLVFASDGGTYVEGFQVVGASWDGINTYVTGNSSFSVVPGEKGRLLNVSRFSASPVGGIDSAGSAEGSYTWAVSDSAHAEGIANKTFGQNSHAEGNSNLAFGESSHAEGEHNKVVGAASHVEGGYNVAFGARSHAEGGGTVAGGKGYGVDNVTSGVVYLSTSYGDLTSLVPWGGGGTLCVVNGTTGKSYVRPYTSFTWDGTYSQFTLVDTTLSFTPGDNVVVVVEGYEGESTADQTVGDYSHAEGGNNKALLTYAHAEGISNKVLSLAGHAEGGYNTVLSEYAHAEGQNNVAFGACSHVGGQDSYALGDHSRAAGRGVIASGSAQTVVGRYNARDNVDSLFVVGAGIGDADVDRGDILRVVCVDTASVGGNVQVTGSMFVSGSRVSIWGGTGVNVAVEPTPGAFVSVGSNAVLNYLSTATGDLGNPTEIWGVSVTSDPLSLGGQFSNYTVMATGSVDGGWTRGVRMMVPKNQNDMRFSVASYEGTLFEMSPTITSQDVMSVDDVGNLRVSGSVAVGPSSVGDVGTDVYFFVSGTMGGKDGSSPGVAVFGGDAVVSGSLYASGNVMDFGGSLYVSGAVGITGSISLSGSYLLNVVSGTTDPTYDVSLWDHVVVFTVNNVTGVLNPAAPVGSKVIFKDGTGAATSNGGQMLSASLGGLIDGAQTFTLPSVDYSSVSVVKINNSPETWVVV